MAPKDIISRPRVAFTLIVLETPAAGGKTFSLDKDGRLRKETVGYMERGTATVCLASGLDGFAELLGALDPGEVVLAYGLPTVDPGEEGVPILSSRLKRQKDAPENAITRSEDFFAYIATPSIMLLDYDPRGGGAALERDAIVAGMVEAAPLLEDHQILAGVSSSSYIYDADGNELQGLRGQRFYAVADDGTDIPRAMDAFVKRLWLAGHGYILISGCGSQLERCLVDPCVWQPSRLDYAAGAVCMDGLEQRRPAHELVNPQGLPSIDTRAAFPDLSAEEEADFRKIVAEAKAATQAEAEATREAWIEARLSEMARAALGSDATDEAIRDEVDRYRQQGRDAALRRAALGDP